MVDVEEALRTELAARIQFQEGTIRTWSSSGSSRTAAIEATARSHTGFTWFDLAVCHVLLGDPGRAAEAFAHAATAMYSSLEITSSLATYSAALETAVLSGDRSLAARVAAKPVPPEPRPSLVGDRLAWALALPALVTGDDGVATIHADAASAVPEKKAWYRGLGEAITAVVSADRPGLTAALQLVLAKHTRYARGKQSWCYNSGPCLICVPAAVLTRLAARRGMTIGPVTGRRASVPFALVHSAPGQVVQIEVDFVPDSLTAP